MCERCGRLEAGVMLLWAEMFPRETHVDAETALRFMTIEAKRAATLREPREIQRAHDALAFALTTPDIRKVLFRDSEEAFSAAIANTDVLCWVLGHDHNETFSQNLMLVDAALAKAGYELIDKGAE